MQLNLPLNTNSIEQSLLGRHVHYVLGPVSQGEKNWAYKHLLVLEVSLDDTNETCCLFGAFC